jgi:hypothetical protein
MLFLSFVLPLFHASMMMAFRVLCGFAEYIAISRPAVEEDEIHAIIVDI